MMSEPASTTRDSTALSCCGASLSVAGAQMQTILSNPLAGPFTLGISAEAGFGAALALAFGVILVPAAVDYVVPINAFVVRCSLR